MILFRRIEVTRKESVDASNLAYLQIRPYDRQIYQGGDIERC